MNSITPVFIIGNARSGTTWLGNLLKKEFRIALPTHPLHYGVKESNIYLNYKYWGNLSDSGSYQRFLADYSKSDYFKLTNSSIDDFDHQSPAHFIEFYLELMDKYALKEGMDYWCTKLCPQFFFDAKSRKLLTDTLEKRYAGRSKFIYIKRAFEDYIHSYINMGGAQYSKRKTDLGQRIALMLGTMRYYNLESEAPVFVKGRDFLQIDYQDLKSDTDSCLSRIKSFAQFAERDQRGEDEKWIRNTSFAQKKLERKYKKSLMTVVIKHNPRLVKWSLMCYETLLKKRKNPAYFRLHLYEHAPDTLIKELESENHGQLVQWVKKHKK